jgi:hypothetical protein
LIVTLNLSLTAFSQTDTNSKPEPVKCFPISKVKEIVKDLKSGDEAKEQLKLSDSLLVVTEKKVELKDSIITTMQIKEQNYVSIIDAQNQKYKVMEDYSKKLEFQLKKEKVKNKFTSIISGVAVLVLGTLLIVH